MVRRTSARTTSKALTTVCRLLHACMFERMATSGIHRGQYHVLAALWKEEGLSHSALARSSLVQPATITTVLQRMERAGLIERRSDPTDQRVSRVYLTDAARAIKGEVTEARQELDRLAFAGLDENELDELCRLLEKVQGNLRPIGKSERKAV